MTSGVYFPFYSFPDLPWKQALPSYYQPWMNIALRLPELVESHQLRSCIKNVSLDNYLNSHFAHFKSKCISDAPAQQSVP